MNVSIHVGNYTRMGYYIMPAKHSMRFSCRHYMRRYFLALHPLIGTKHKPAAISQQQRSPYYWWWAYLKRNQQYIKCCENDGKGNLAKLYMDFDDVRSDDFPSWWARSYQRGQDLFAEVNSDIRVRKLDSKTDWPDEWSDADVMVVAVNMEIGRRKLQKMFANVLQKNHKGMRGRKPLGKAVSTSKYPLYRNFSRHSLKTMLQVYDAWYENSQLPKSQQKPLWAIGEEVKITPHQITSEGDDHYTVVNKHKIMTATVSRYVNSAKVIIANTAKGEFPNSSVD
jgi:hypothetical protein